MCIIVYWGTFLYMRRRDISSKSNWKNDWKGKSYCSQPPCSLKWKFWWCRNFKSLIKLKEKDFKIISRDFSTWRYNNENRISTCFRLRGSWLINNSIKYKIWRWFKSYDARVKDYRNFWILWHSSFFRSCWSNWSLTYDVCKLNSWYCSFISK